MKEQTLMTFDEWRALSAESRARINAYGLEMERLRAELEKRQWIPVAERLPEKGDDVLVLWEGDMIVMYINRHGNWAFTLDSEELETGEVTHWMPLPEPPKDGE